MTAIEGWKYSYDSNQTFRMNQISTLNEVVFLFGFYGISTLLGYLMPNPFLFSFISNNSV